MKTLPHSPESEASILGAVLLTGGRSLVDIRVALEPGDFYHPANAAVWEVVQELARESTPTDAVTVLEGLRSRELVSRLNSVGGAVYMDRLMEQAVTFSNIDHHARIVKTKAIRRAWVQAGSKFVANGTEDGDDREYLAECEAAVSALLNLRSISDPRSLKDLFREFSTVLDKRYENRKAVTGVPSGLVDLDETLGGFQPGELIVIAARPSMGKTALAMNVAVNAARNGFPFLVLSMEMSDLSLIERVLASEGRIDSQRLRTGLLGSKEFSSITASYSRLSGLPGWIADLSSPSITDLQTLVRRWHAKHCKDKQGIVLLDYLQLIRSEGSNREQEVASISRQLKATAKELSVPVIALSQLNRSLESRGDKRPMLSDLRESGAIEQDSDVVTFIYRDERYNPESEHKGKAELIISKNRNGGTGTVMVAFNAEYTQFANLTPRSDS